MFLKSSRRGSVLVFSLLILSILLVTSLTILSTSLLDRKASLSTSSSTRSFQVADSGVEEALYQIYKADHPTLAALTASIAGATCSGSTLSFPSVGGNASVTFYEDETTPYAGGCNGTDWRDKVVKIKSEGVAGSNARAVEVAVQTACPTVKSTRPFSKVTTASGPAEVRNGIGGAMSDVFSGKYILAGSREIGCGYPGNGGDGQAEDVKNAYVGLYVFDVSNPLSPTEVGFLPTAWNSDGTTAAASSEIYGYGTAQNSCQNPTDIKIRGDYAYVSTDTGNFIIVDISDYTQARATPELRLVSRPDQEHGAEMYRRLYMYSFNSGLYCAWHPASTYAVDLDASGDTLFVSTQGGINIYDVHDPANINEISDASDFKECGNANMIYGVRLSTPYLQRGGVTDLMVDPDHSNILYVIYKVGGYHTSVSADDRKSWIGAYDITDKNNIVQIGKYIFGSEADDPYRFVKQGDYLYVTQWETPALVTLRVTVAAGPAVTFSKTDEAPLPGNGNDIRLNGDELFIVGNNFINIFDISNNNDDSPVETASMDAPVSGKSVLGIDNAIYLADQEGFKSLCR